MDMTTGVVIIVVVAIALLFLLARSRRNEAAAPVDGPVPHPPGNAMKARESRENQPLVDWLLARATEQTGTRVADDPLARQRIADAAAQAMETLRSGGTASITLPFLVADASGPKHFDVRFRRNVDSTFEVER